MYEDEYLKYQRKKLARRIQRERGIKYTTAWRIVNDMSDKEVKDGVETTSRDSPPGAP